MKHFAVPVKVCYILARRCDSEKEKWFAGTQQTLVKLHQLKITEDLPNAERTPVARNSGVANLICHESG